MKLLGRLRTPVSDRNSADSAETDTVAEGTSPATGETKTLSKGRPTPKRREAQARRRGPVAPAPMTAAEARARRKSLKGDKASKQERKLAAAQRRSTAADRRARMMAGEDKYLLPRDKGPVRAYARNIIDSRRNLLGLFMPMALVLIFATLALQQIAALVTLAMLFMMILMIIEGFYLGRLVNQRVAERFPDTTDGGFKLGWYSFIRASQLRKMRAPAPQVKAGDAV